jgi:uncharacterized protein
MKRLLVSAFLALASPLTAQLQDSSQPVSLQMQIVVVGHGEVKMSPDRATIQISVQTRAATAAAAAAENAVKQRSVIAALKELGLSDSELSTVNYNVYPEQRYEEGKQPTVVAYTVTNTILVDARKLTQVGTIIDAAPSHGANLISALQFYSSNAAVARRSAIAAAIESARADADAAARAAGGLLGPLIEINIGSPSPPPPRPMAMLRASSASAETPINPWDETLSVEVATRWHFVPAR